MTSHNPIPSCELCAAPASLYCPSDSAFLCPSCDSYVHRANFLVARHLRHPLPPCSLSSDHAPSTSSSACISTTRSSFAVSSAPEGVTSGRLSKGGATRRDSKAEAVFAIWCKRMGLEREAADIIHGASRFLAAWRGRGRLAVAVSFWMGMRRWSTWQSLKRVEEVSGVPGKVIAAAEAKMKRAVREAQREQVGRVDLREGWAECGSQ